MGLHYHIEAEHVSVNASVYNGEGYGKTTGRESVFRFRPGDDGVFAVADVQYSRNGSRYFAGGAFHCKDGVSVSPWVYAEQSINDKVSLFAGYSHAFTEEYVECRDFVGLGAFCQLGKVDVGIFTGFARFAEEREYATEFTCRISISDNVSIQPAVHLIADNLPASEQTRRRAIAAVRMEVSF